MIDNFLTWYSTLQGPEQIFWTIALIATAVFAVQMILTIVGIDAHDVADLDFADGDTMDTGGAVSLFSVRSLVNFFVGLGWGGDITAARGTSASTTTLRKLEKLVSCIFTTK